jgi:hypothetical protein
MAYYAEPAPGTTSFGASSTTAITPSVPARQIVEIGHLLYQTTVGNWDQRSIGLNGWGIDILHHYDLLASTLYTGDGQKIAARLNGNQTSIFAGTGQSGNIGDGGPATLASLDNPIGLWVMPDGSVYVASSDRIRLIDPNGNISLFAGGGTSTQDGVSRLNAQFGYVAQMAMGPDGSLYFCDFTKNNIRKISPQGIVTTVAGGGKLAPSSTPVPALQAALSGPVYLAMGPDGTLYFASASYSTPDTPGLFRVGQDGNLSLVAGTASMSAVQWS